MVFIDTPPASSYTSLVPSKKIDKVRIYSDGGARGNPGPAAIGVILCDEKGHILQEHNEVIGEATNNIAEYTAILVGLELAAKAGARRVDYFTDSELAANQLAGRYRVKAPHILSLFKLAKEKEKSFERVTYTHVPRTHPQLKHADKLVNEALDEAGH